MRREELDFSAVSNIDASKERCAGAERSEARRIFNEAREQEWDRSALEVGWERERSGKGVGKAHSSLSQFLSQVPPAPASLTRSHAPLTHLLDLQNTCQIPTDSCISGGRSLLWATWKKCTILDQTTMRGV